MKYQILFTDLDGTLLNSQKNISKKTLQKIQELLNHGQNLVLASGRPLYSILERKKALGIPDYHVYISAYNGALLYDCEQACIMAQYPVSIPVVQKLFHLANEKNIHIHTFQDQKVISNRDDEEIKYYTSFVPSEVVISSNLSLELEIEPYKLLAIDLQEHETRNLLAFKNTLLSLTDEIPIQCAFSHPTYLELFAREAGKGKGLLHLCELLHIPVEASVAVGDEENDLSMIEAAGLGIAMKNGASLLKKKAGHVTALDNDHDAIANIIEQFLIS